jgi:hypothetical protein
MISCSLHGKKIELTPQEVNSFVCKESDHEYYNIPENVIDEFSYKMILSQNQIVHHREDLIQVFNYIINYIFRVTILVEINFKFMNDLTIDHIWVPIGNEDSKLLVQGQTIHVGMYLDHNRCISDTLSHPYHDLIIKVHPYLNNFKAVHLVTDQELSVRTRTGARNYSQCLSTYNSYHILNPDTISSAITYLFGTNHTCVLYEQNDSYKSAIIAFLSSFQMYDTENTFGIYQHFTDNVYDYIISDLSKEGKYNVIVIRSINRNAEWTGVGFLAVAMQT